MRGRRRPDVSLHRGRETAPWNQPAKGRLEGYAVPIHQQIRLIHRRGVFHKKGFPCGIKDRIHHRKRKCVYAASASCVFYFLSLFTHETGFWFFTFADLCHPGEDGGGAGMSTAPARLKSRQPTESWQRPIIPTSIRATRMPLNASRPFQPPMQLAVTRRCAGVKIAEKSMPPVKKRHDVRSIANMPEPPEKAATKVMKVLQTLGISLNFSLNS
jgi:hypothetical protein